MAIDEVQDVVLVTQLPSDSWFEGFALRPNGKTLASRLDKPELYTFKAEDPDAVPELIYTFSDANGLINVCPIPGTTDEYLLVSGYVDLDKVTFEKFLVWRVVLSPDDSSPPQVTKVAAMPDAGFCIGCTPVSDRILLIPDAHKNCIWRLDIQTGKSEVFVAHDLMKVASKEDFFGLNRMRLAGGFLWFTNTSAGTLNRIPIEMDEDHPEVGIRMAGPVENITDGLPHCDGLAITDDLKTAYTASYIEGHVWKVNMDPATGKSHTDVIMTSLDSPTGVELVTVHGEQKLYIVCCGEIEMAWMTPDDQNPWAGLADLNSAVTVTVTEEVVETS